MITSDFGYVIYSAHYQETSAIIKLLTSRHGLVSVMVRGVHQPNKKSNVSRAAIQLGTLVECQWNGKTSLKTSYQLEMVSAVLFDSAEKFICLSYVHELLLYFLREEFPIENTFADYGNLIDGLSNNIIAMSLRNFEFSLLESLGYGMDFSYDIESGDSLHPHRRYLVTPGAGVSCADAAGQNGFLGEDLLAIQQRHLTSPHLLNVAKKITRGLLAFYMEGKPIKSRQMYQDLFSG